MSDKPDDLPQTRKVGRYFFFGLCAYGLGLLVYALCRKLGFVSDVCSPASAITAVAAFLALRDMARGA